MCHLIALHDTVPYAPLHHATRFVQMALLCVNHGLNNVRKRITVAVCLCLSLPLDMWHMWLSCQLNARWAKDIKYERLAWKCFTFLARMNRHQNKYFCVVLLSQTDSLGILSFCLANWCWEAFCALHPSPASSIIKSLLIVDHWCGLLWTLLLRSGEVILN